MNLQIFHDFAIFFDNLFETRPKGWAYSQRLTKFKQSLNTNLGNNLSCVSGIFHHTEISLKIGVY
jgi:hypothetical protein